MSAPGDRIGRYELVALLGRGGHGSVWEAVLHGPRGFRKPVALKRMIPRADLPDALVEEARLGAWLSHPNVVEVYELDEIDGELVLSMELVRGASAADLARQEPLPTRALQELGLQAARALAHVHATRIDGVGALVHRDVKPANLLVDRTGTVKLADFGIARLCGGGSAPVAGTPGFMAPEQRDGREGPPADLFALGVTLCVLATGQRPFGRGLASLVALDDPEGAWVESGLAGELERALPGLGEVVGRCLRADPAARWPDAAALGDALASLRAPTGASLLERLAQVRPGLGVEPPSHRSALASEPTRIVPRGSIPRRSDTFVGRTAELAQVIEALGSSRLVTLVGPGGAGKTRLAIEAARGIDRGGGAWFCELDRATDAVELAEGVARGLGVPLGGADPVAEVGHLLAARGPLLLVLDNLEQVIGPAAPVVSGWLAAAPQLTVLATSRIPLHLSDEVRVGLGPLDPRSAAELFARRAPRAPTAADGPAVDAIVAALDHLPLPIELAAAWTRLLPPPRILEQLDDRFRLLAHGPADAPDRHRSLRACLDGSFQLLAPVERDAIAALSVFAGPFEFRAAERVVPRAPDGPWVLDVLARLVDTSLLQVEGDRFRVLQSVRAYADELLGPRERDRAERAHGEALASAWSPVVLAELDRVEPITGPRRLALEVADLVLAARRAIGRGDARVASATASAAAVHYARHGPVGPGLDLLEAVVAAFPADGEARAALARVCISASAFARAEQVLAAPTEDPLTAQLLWAAVHRGLERLDAAEVAARAALELAQARSDGRHTAAALHELGLIHRMASRLPEAREQLERSLAVARERGDRWAAGRALSGLGAATLQAGEHAAARAALDEGIAIARELGDRRAEAVGLANLGLVENNLGDEQRARQLMSAALDLQRELGLRAVEAQTLANLAALSPTAEGIALLERARRIHAELGHRRSEAIAIGNIGVLLIPADPVAGRRHVEDALARHRELGNLLDQAVMSNALADLDRAAGDLDAAERRLHEVIALARRLDAKRPWLQALIYLADVARDRGDAEAERSWLVEAHALAVRTGDRRAAELSERLSS